MPWLTSSSILELQQESTSSADWNTVITDYLIPYVEKAFKTMSNNPIDLAAVTERIYVNGTKEIVLHRNPVTVMTSISLVAGSWISEISSILSSTTYDVFANGIVRFREPITGILEVIYSGGYDTCPEDVKNVCALQVWDLLNQRKRLGLTTESKGGVGTTYGDIPWLPQFLNVIELYKNPIESREII